MLAFLRKKSFIVLVISSKYILKYILKVIPKKNTEGITSSIFFGITTGYTLEEYLRFIL